MKSLNVMPLLPQRKTRRYNIYYMFYYIYKVTNPITGEFYIGSRQTKSDPFEDKYMGSMKTWKVDKSLLVKEIIRHDFTDRQELLEIESKMISEEINHPLNRNYSIPNVGFYFCGEHSDETKDKISKSLKKQSHLISEKNKGRKHSEDTKRKISEGGKGRIVSDETIEKMKKRIVSEETKEKLRHPKSEETKKKISESSKKLSPDIRKKISEAASLSNKGKPLKEETKEKLSKSLKGRIISDETKIKFSNAKTGKVCVKDKDGNKFLVDSDDIRYINGELVGVSKGLWGWSKKIEIDGIISSVKEFSVEYETTVGKLKEKLSELGIVYKEV